MINLINNICLDIKNGNYESLNKNKKLKKIFKSIINNLNEKYYNKTIIDLKKYLDDSKVFIREFKTSQKISGNRKIGDFSIFNTQDEKLWEDMYDLIMNVKYKKNKRNFSKKLQGKEYSGNN